MKSERGAPKPTGVRLAVGVRKSRSARVSWLVAVGLIHAGIVWGQQCPASHYTLRFRDPSPISIVLCGSGQPSCTPSGDSIPQVVVFEGSALPIGCPVQISPSSSGWSIIDQSIASLRNCSSNSTCTVHGEAAGQTNLHVSASSTFLGVSNATKMKPVFVTGQQQPPPECRDSAGLVVPCGGSCVVGTTANAVRALSKSTMALAAATASAPPIAGSCDPQGGTVEIITSGDPNDKVGNPGAGPVHYLSGSQQLDYSIYFDNVPTATAPAQKVVVTDQLNSSLVDLTTLILGPISLVDKLITPPSVPLSILGAYTTDIDLRPTKTLIVRIAAALNPTTGVLTWIYTSLDPTTMQPTTDPLAGFLPPGTEGSVSFTVIPKTLSTGAQITNKATIVFDVNQPIDTPVWLNTIDNTKPTSHLNTLAATQTTASFTVSWAGTDTGAGVQDYTVYSSDNGGPFTAWQTNTTATSASFIGAVDHTYRFYSLARDLVGNTEILKSTAEATTTITIPPTSQCTGCYFVISGVRATLAFNVASVGSASTFSYNYRTSTQTVQFVSTTTSQIVVNGNTATFSGQGKLNGIAGYNFAVTAKDGGGIGSGLDTVSISITGPNNYSYAANGTIAGGDIVVKQ